MGQAVNVRSSKKIAKNNFDKERIKQVVADLRLFIQDVFSKGTYANRKANKLVGIKKDFQIVLINDIKINAVKQIKDIDILYTEDLKYVFDYILNKYGKDKRHIYELYEKVL